MKKTSTLLLVLAFVATTWGQVPRKNVQNSSSIDLFWEKFRAAVTKEDKVTLAGLSQFPIGMPYGVPVIRTSAQLAKRYREVFNGEANAANCFREARPEINSDNPREFTVACRNAAGDEVIIYLFVRTRNGWKFRGLDNLNE